MTAESPPRLSRSPILDVSWTSGLRLLSALLYLVVATLLARTSAVSVFAGYFLVMSCVSFIALAGSFGTYQLAVRDVAKPYAEGDLATAAHAAGRSIALSVTATAALAGLVGLGAVLVPVRWTPAGPVAFVIAGILLAVTVTCQQLLPQLLRSVRRFRASEITGTGAPYLLLAASLALCAATSTRPSLNALMVLTAICYAIPAAFGLALLARDLGGARRLLRAMRPRWSHVTDLSSSVYVVTHSGSLLVVRQGALWAAALTLGAPEIAIFAAATRIAGLLALPLSVVNSVVGPHIAARYDSRGDNAPLENTLAVTALLAGAPAILAVGFIAAFPGQIMHIAFGDAFVGGATVLVLLSVGQLFNVLAGSCGVALVMTGHARLLMRVSVVTAIATMAGGILAGSVSNGAGIALAFAVGLALQNVAMALLTWRLSRLRTYLRPMVGIKLLIGGRS